MRVQHSLLAASVALAISGGAQAGLLGAANEVFIGGATAPQNFLREDIMLRICDSNIQVYVDEIENPGGVADVLGGNLLQQGDHFIVRCTAKSTFGTALDGADIAIYKYNGGSATGVAPVSDTSTTDFMDAAPGNCNAPTVGIPSITGGAPYDLYECPAAPVVQQVPDAGVSDIEPQRFTGPLALDFGVEPLGVSAEPTAPFVDRGNLEVVPGPGLTFGVAVTLPLYDALIDAQQAAGMPWMAGCPASPTRAERDSLDCMPSLPKAEVQKVFAGDITSWADFEPYGLTLTNTTPEGNNVHLCKRTNGSGTHAQHSIQYLGTNCREGLNTAMLEQNNGVAFAPAGFVGVYANSGSSDMDDCLDALGSGAGFDGDFDGLPPTSFPDTGDSTVVPGSAIGGAGIPIPGDPLGRNYDADVQAFGMGYNSMEKNTSLARAYRFVKVDGYAPTLENAQYGLYDQTYFLSFQHRLNGAAVDAQTGPIRTVPASGAQIAVMDAYLDIYNAIAPAAIDAVNVAFEVDPNGVAGDGDEWAGGFLTTVTGAAFTGALPETPYTRRDGAGAADSCKDLR